MVYDLMGVAGSRVLFSVGRHGWHLGQPLFTPTRSVNGFSEGHFWTAYMHVRICNSLEGELACLKVFLD